MSHAGAWRLRPGCAQEFLTTTEAAGLTRHSTRKEFLDWAKSHAPEILVRLPGRRNYLVSKSGLEKMFGLTKTD